MSNNRATGDKRTDKNSNNKKSKTKKEVLDWIKKDTKVLIFEECSNKAIFTGCVIEITNEKKRLKTIKIEGEPLNGTISIFQNITLEVVSLDKKPMFKIKEAPREEKKRYHLKEATDKAA